MEQINKNNFKSNMINIEKVADILGVSIDETFKIQFYGHKNPYKQTIYKLTKNGLMHRPEKSKCWSKSDALEGLILGKHQISK